jgi:hypothetical protein
LRESTKGRERNRRKNVLIKSGEEANRLVANLLELTEEGEKVKTTVQTTSKTFSMVHKYILRDCTIKENQQYLRKLYEGVEYSLNILRQPSFSYIA